MAASVHALHLNENMAEKTGTTEVHKCITYFQDFDQLANSSIIFEWILCHTIDHKLTFIHWQFYIT